MMKALGILVRLLCSLLVLVAAALYLQAGICNIAPETFVGGLTPDSAVNLFTSLNWVSITAGVLVVLALMRILDMAWNVLFCLSFIPVLFCGLYAVFGPMVALPAPLQGNELMLQFCELPQSYPVPALIIVGIFALGWLASTAPFRIALSTLISFGLWYGITFLMHYVIITRWAETPEPAQPEILTLLLLNPWMMAALPGAFFLMYAVLVSFFETFLGKKKKKPAAKKEETPAVEAPKDENNKEAEKTQAQKATSPAPAAKATVPAKTATPKLIKKPATVNEKPAEAPKAKAPKADETPAEAPKADAPKADETPAKAPKADAPKADEQPAEAPKADAPKADETPAEAHKANAPQADETPAEAPKADTPKADETPAEAPKA